MRDSFDIKKWIENPDELLLIAGPCSVESKEQFFDVATKLSELQEVKILRGGIWKPRTRPNGFEGIGEEGLKWMREISEETNLPVMTEVATPEHAELALKYGVDVFAIGSDWVGQFDYLNEFCEVVYLPRTDGISSTQLRQEQASLKIGIVGTGGIAKRFVPESRYVNSVSIEAVYNPNRSEALEDLI